MARKGVVPGPEEPAEDERRRPEPVEGREKLKEAKEREGPRGSILALDEEASQDAGVSEPSGPAPASPRPDPGPGSR